MHLARWLALLIVVDVKKIRLNMASARAEFVACPEPQSQAKLSNGPASTLERGTNPC